MGGLGTKTPIVFFISTFPLSSRGSIHKPFNFLLVPHILLRQVTSNQILGGFEDLLGEEGIVETCFGIFHVGLLCAITASHGGYGVTVNTGACGALNSSSILDSRPIFSGLSSQTPPQSLHATPPHFHCY